MPEMITSKTARLLAWAGCRQFNIGVESGSEKIRKEILNRNVSDNHLITASKACKENNISLFTFNMLGIPHEGVKDMLATVKINAKIGTAYPNAFVFYPYPGTELYKLCKKEGLLTDRSFKTFTQSSPLSYDYSTLASISFFRNLFFILVVLYKFIYTRNRKLGRILEHMLDSFLCSGVLSLTLYPIVNSLIELARRSRIYNRLLKTIKGDTLYLF